jgi:AcrR family transcriptional regulator
VSILCQYFPNKEAILFRLQTDESDQIRAVLEGILGKSDEPALDRLRSMVGAIVAQIVAKLQFDQSPSKPIWAGGVFIVVGGLTMTLWRTN